MAIILKTVDIKGKQYVPVNERIKYFRSAEEYKGWSLFSEIVEVDNTQCIIKATILDEKGNVRATGIAHELQSGSYINKGSFVENCETSAWGRALGNLGIGIDNSIATYEEMYTAIELEDKDKLSNRPVKTVGQPQKAEKKWFNITYKDGNETKEWIALKKRIDTGKFGAENIEAMQKVMKLSKESKDAIINYINSKTD